MVTRDSWLAEQEAKRKARNEQKLMRRKFQDLVQVTQEELNQAVLKNDIKTALQLSFRLGDFFTKEDGKIFEGLKQFPQKYIDKITREENALSSKHELERAKAKLKNFQRTLKRRSLVERLGFICPKCKCKEMNLNKWVVMAWRRKVRSSTSWRPMCRKCYVAFLEGSKRKPPHRPKAGSVPADLKCPKCKKQYTNPARRFWCVTLDPVVCRRCGVYEDVKQETDAQHLTLIEILAVLRTRTSYVPLNKDPLAALSTLWTYYRNACLSCGDEIVPCDECKKYLRLVSVKCNALRGTRTLRISDLEKRLGAREAQEQVAALKEALTKEASRDSH